MLKPDRGRAIIVGIDVLAKPDRVDQLVSVIRNVPPKPRGSPAWGADVVGERRRTAAGGYVRVRGPVARARSGSRAVAVPMGVSS